MPRETSQTRKGNRTKKGNKRKRTFYNIVIIILSIIIAFSLFQIGKILWGYYKGTHEYNSVAKVAGVYEGNEFNVDFDALLKQNPDTKAWLKSPGTNINYPVLQAKDNDYYLYRMFNGEYNRKGSLFIDYRITDPFEDFLTIIYGHNMLDDTMFAHLMDYREMDYYKKHKYMRLLTPTNKYKLEIVGAMYLNANASQYKFSFNEPEKQSYADWINANSDIQTDSKATKDDKLVMLSTCTNVDEDGRYVVFGKLIPMEDM